MDGYASSVRAGLWSAPLTASSFFGYGLEPLGLEVESGRASRSCVCALERRAKKFENYTPSAPNAEWCARCGCATVRQRRREDARVCVCMRN